LLERDTFDLFLPEFDKPWVIHLRETCCCSKNLCTWRHNIVYKNRSVRRHQCIVSLDPKNSFANFDEDKLIELVEMYAGDFSIYEISFVL
jgi:hypothetical protein